MLEKTITLKDYIGIVNKKRVAIQTDHSTWFTGFSKFKRALLRYLYKTGKYEIIELSNGVPHGSPELNRLPWPCFSTMPTPEQQQQINSIQDHGQREAAHRQANYGRYGMGKLLKDNGVDVLVQSQDSWGIDFAPSIPEVKNVTFIPHCTIDSENLLQSQLDLARQVNKLYVWASFALEEYAKHDITNVEYLPGCVDSSNFSPLPIETKNNLKNKFGLNHSFSMIYTARNQLRKLFPNLFDGFKLFKEKYPESNAKLILLTSAQEGWNLQELAKQKGIDNGDIYLCYHCRSCKHYELKPFFGHDQNCPHCGAEKTFNTINIIHGISEEQLNEAYNCADVFVSCHTSGGMEIAPSIEAKCAGLPILSTSYSCGEDIVGDDRGGIALDYSTYYEHPSGFLKASSQDYHVLEGMEKVWNMTPEERAAFGLKGRQFVLENLAPEIIGKRFEEIIDAAPFADWENFNPAKNPNHQPPSNLSPESFVLDLFHNMMMEKVSAADNQVKFWTEHLVKSKDYQGVYNHFARQAQQSNAQIEAKPFDFNDRLDPTDGKRLLIVMPESAGDIILVNSLVPKVKKQYPEFRIYFATKPQFKDLVEHLEGVTWLEYIGQMDDIFWLTGRDSHKGFFDIAFLPHMMTQRAMNYQWRENNLRPEWINSATINQ